MNKVVVVAHPQTGLVVTRNESNPEYGTLRLDQVSRTITNNFINESRRTVFIRGNYDLLVSLGYKANQKLAGKIIKLESFNPFYIKSDGTPQEPKINPTTQEVILKDGKPVYLEFQYVEDESTPDQWVENPLESVETSSEDSSDESGTI